MPKKTEIRIFKIPKNLKLDYKRENRWLFKNTTINIKKLTSFPYLSSIHIKF